MAFIPFPEGARAVFEFGQVSYSWTNTMWFHDLSGPPQDFQGLADWLHTWAVGTFPMVMDDSAEFRQVKVYDMSSSLGQVYISSGSPAAGAVAGDNVPLNIALVVTFYSAVRGPSGRGRNYVAGLSEAQVSTDRFSDNAALALFEARYQSLITDVQTNTGWYWVVASQYQNGLPRNEVLANDVVNTTVRSPIVGTQRRRVPRP